MTSLSELLAGLDQLVADEIATMPDVKTVRNLNLDRLPKPGTRLWLKQEDVYAVVCDLVGSTKLGTGSQREQSTASIYEAATGGAVKVLSDADADFVDIQGDGAFGLFWGEAAAVRAMCAAVTIQTFSVRHLTKRLESRWPDMPQTGFKVGVAKGRVLVKLVGTRYRIAEQEAIWAGKPVNYAAKCAQSAERHNIIVTSDVWTDIRGNDFLEFSCGCHGEVDAEGLHESTGPPTNEIWKDAVVDRLPDDEQHCRRVESTWCLRHGEDFRAAVLAGETVNPEAAELRELVGAANRDAAAKALKARIGRDQRNHRDGMRNR